MALVLRVGHCIAPLVNIYHLFLLSLIHVSGVLAHISVNMCVFSFLLDCRFERLLCLIWTFLGKMTAIWGGRVALCLQTHWEEGKLCYRFGGGK